MSACEVDGLAVDDGFDALSIAIVRELRGEIGSSHRDESILGVVVQLNGLSADDARFRAGQSS